MKLNSAIEILEKGEDSVSTGFYIFGNLEEVIEARKLQLLFFSAFFNKLYLALIRTLMKDELLN